MDRCPQVGKASGESTTYYTAAETLVSDYMMWCPTRRIARWTAPAVDAYLYFFSELPDLDDEVAANGVFHGAEVRFAFFDQDQLVGWDENVLTAL